MAPEELDQTRAKAADDAGEQPSSHAICAPGELAPTKPSHFVVGIGASAGGLEAIERFFDQVPLDSGLSFVLVQHLSPDFKSLMDELLARHTRLSIHRVENGMTLQPNAIYLIPPKKNMVLSFGKLLLTDQDQKSGLNLPIDIFFHSLAQDMGDRAVAMVLSGTGSDGSRGIKEIHESGGLVIVQDPETAAFDGMPRSAIATGMVDFILSPEEMPARILAYVRNPVRVDHSKPALEIKVGEELSGVLALLRRQFGVDFTLYKPTTLARRLERRMTLQNAASVPEYLALLQANAEEVDALYRDLLVEVTQFFRDPEAFEVIRRQIVPAVVDHASPEDGIRVWVPGCATGQEAYSLAMLFQEYAETIGKRLDVKIFATDAHRGSLETASNGEYDAASFEEFPRRLQERYFVKKRNRFIVNPELRKLVIFAPHNLTKDPPFTKLDFISCRNVLIYLNPPTQQKILTLFHFGLRTGGTLFLGPSESVGDLEEEFEVVDRHWKIFRKKRNARLTGPAGVLGIQPPTEVTLNIKQRLAGLSKTDFPVPEVYESLLAQFVPPSFLLSDQHDLLHVFGNAGRFLRVPEGKATRDALKMVDDSLRIAIVSALHRARKDKKCVSYHGIRTQLDGQECSIKLSVTPVAGRRAPTAYFLVALEEEANDDPPAVTTTEHRFDVGGVAAERILGLERDLNYAKEHLQSTVEELETSNEELQSTNEELVASNEELQSTNEELHSVNEELYTVNAEHQRKIDELVLLTNDMDNLLSSTEIGTIFLDNDLTIRKFTPAIARVFNLLPQDVGRPLMHISNDLNIGNDKLLELIERMRASESVVEYEVEGPRQRSFLMRILPYRTQNGAMVTGAVLTFVDVTQVKEATRELGLSQRRLDAALTFGEIGTWDWDVGNDIVVLGHRFLKILSVAPDAGPLAFADFVQLIHPEDRDGFQHAARAALVQATTFDGGFRVSLPDGMRSFLTRADVLRDPDGKPTRMTGVCIDVSERKQMAAALRESETRLQSILDNSSAFIFVKDLQGRYLLANRSFADLLGKPIADIVGKTDAELFPTPRAQELREHDRLVIAEGNIRRTEIVFALPEGERVYWTVLFPLREPDGRLTGVAGIASDITDRKRAEDEARLALQRRDQFLAMLSHELRNPLGALVNAAHLLARDGVSSEAHAEARHVIQRQTKQMAGLLDDLLDVSRIAQNRIRLQRKRVKLNDAVEEALVVVRPQLEANHLRLAVDLGSDACYCLGDAGRLQQMVVNVLTNAVKYTPPGGEIALSMSRDNHDVVISVRDSGVGIRPEMLQRIFDMFVQADETLDRAKGGMGVGLTLVRAVAELHGGRVEARSAGPGAGAEFIIHLPLAADKPAPADVLSDADAPGTCRVLIVEDNPDSRRMLQALLESDGYEVHAAATGSEGLDAILRLRPDAAVIDIGLPGLDGYEVARRTRQRLSHDEILLIALTGYGRQEDRRAVIDAGFDEHLVKPLNPEDLARILRKRSSTGGAA